MNTEGMPQIIRQGFMGFELSCPSTQIIEYKADKIIAETIQSKVWGIFNPLARNWGKMARTKNNVWSRPKIKKNTVKKRQIMERSLFTYMTPNAVFILLEYCRDTITFSPLSIVSKSLAPISGRMDFVRFKLIMTAFDARKKELFFKWFSNSYSRLSVSYICCSV